ncbi:MAG: hypothetical protein AABW89_05735 [Nanoarchaeota archaeon]|mgnify:CR=1 FL=1
MGKKIFSYLSGKIKEKYEQIKKDRALKTKEREKILRINKPLNYQQFSKLSSAQRKLYLLEWAYECNNCGEKWHYLGDVENDMKSQLSSNSCYQCGSCHSCNSFFITSAITSNAQEQLKRQIKGLKQCPKCGSSNADYEAKFFRR